jgi:hypothetical protein
MMGKGFQKSLRAGRVRPIVKGEHDACSRLFAPTEGAHKITKPDHTDSQAEQEEVETEQGAYSHPPSAPF